MLKRILKVPEQSFFLLGPRGSGKSTWLRSMFTDAWCKGLRAVEPLEGLQRRIVVYPRGPVMKTRGGIDVLPFKHFADELAAGAL